MNFCNNENYIKIEEYINNHKESIINDLMDLVSVPSVQGESFNGMPYGVECDNMLKMTALLYEQHGFNTVIKNENGYAISNFGEQATKTIGVFSHGDVVPADGEWLICPPFAPKIVDGHIIGRGANDDKSGIVEALYALKFIRDLKIPIKSNILVFTGVNEETGMGDITEFARCEKMPDVSLVLDGEYPYYKGESSIFKFDLTSKKSFKFIKSISGGKSYNIVLGRAVCETEYNSEIYKELEKALSDNPSFELKSDNKSIYITAKGRENHIIKIDDSINAVKLLCDVLIKIESLQENDKEILREISFILNGGHGECFGLDKITDEIYCGNGIVSTDDTEKIKLCFDLRCPHDSDLVKITKTVKASVSDNFIYEEKRVSRGYLKKDDDVIGKVVSDAYYAVSGDYSKKPIKIAGGTYTRVLENSFSIGTVGYYKAKPINLPKGHGGVHQPDEKLNIDGFLEAIKILICMIMELDAYLN